nr:GDSL-type esterase/lipase family protein [Micromonospora sp. DSM 115978]
RAAPNARVVVLGYPRLFEQTRSCGWGGLSLAKRELVNDGADALTQLISARAAAAGFEFVDVRPVFAGHGICGTSPWINGSLLTSGAGAYHPNADGYRLGYLAALSSVTG